MKIINFVKKKIIQLRNKHQMKSLKRQKSTTIAKKVRI